MFHTLHKGCWMDSRLLSLFCVPLASSPPSHHHDWQFCVGPKPRLLTLASTKLNISGKRKKVDFSNNSNWWYLGTGSHRRNVYIYCMRGGKSTKKSLSSLTSDKGNNKKKLSLFWLMLFHCCYICFPWHWRHWFISQTTNRVKPG